MNPYVFMTDSDSDLPFRYVDELDMTMVYMPYILDGKEYFDDLGRSGKQKEYFDNMRAGAAPVTSLLPTAAYVEYFEPCFKEGRDILFVAFSSQLSGTINNVYAARDELLAKYPDRRMTVVDTLSISAPQTILILKAHELYRRGKSMDEVAQWLEDNKMRAQAWFTVDDLKYLRRGGRIRGNHAGPQAHHHREPGGETGQLRQGARPQSGAAPDCGQGSREHRRSRAGDDHHPARGRAGRRRAAGNHAPGARARAGRDSDLLRGPGHRRALWPRHGSHLFLRQGASLLKERHA